jgi:hypothetical protein
MTGYAGGRLQGAHAGTAGPELSVHVDRQDAGVTVQLRGRLDEPTEVEALVTALLADGGSVVCDLRELDYLSPWAVDMLLEIQCTRPPTPPALALCVAAPGQVSRVLAAHDRKRFLPLSLSTYRAPTTTSPRSIVEPPSRSPRTPRRLDGPGHSPPGSVPNGRWARSSMTSSCWSVSWSPTPSCTPVPRLSSSSPAAAGC